MIYSRTHRALGAFVALLAVVAGVVLAAGCSSQKPIRITDNMMVIEPVSKNVQGSPYDQNAEFDQWMVDNTVLKRVANDAPNTLIIYVVDPDMGGDFEKTEVQKGSRLHTVAAVIRHVAADLGTMNKLPRSMNAIQKLAIELMAWIGNDEYARRVYPDGTAGRPVYALAKKPVSTSATTCKTASPTATSTRSRSTGKPACVK